MKKKLVLVLAAAMAISVCASGCGENENEGTSAASETNAEAEAVVYTAEEMLAGTEYDVNDYVKLADYKNIEVEVDQDYEVTEDYITESINSVMAYYPGYAVADKTAEDGDRVNIDYVGTMDGEEFEGGSYEGYDLVLGSDSFIEGFEDGLIGTKAGDTVALDLTFPEDYDMEDVAGKDVTFTVTVNSVSEETTYTIETAPDDYISENFYYVYGVSTLDEFVDYIEQSLESSLQVAIQEAYIEKLVAGSEVTLPEGLLDERVETSIETYTAQVEAYDMTLESYLADYYEQTVEEFTEELRTSLEASLYEELVLEALVSELGCSVDSTEFDAFVTYFANSYYMEEEDFIEQCGGKDYLILNYAEYYVALEEGASMAKVTFVDVPDEEETTEE